MRGVAFAVMVVVAGLATAGPATAATRPTFSPDPRAFAVNVPTDARLALSPSVPTVDADSLYAADGTPNAWVQRKSDPIAVANRLPGTTLTQDGAMNTLDVAHGACLPASTKLVLVWTAKLRAGDVAGTFQPGQAVFTTSATPAPACGAAQYAFATSLAWGGKGGVVPTSLTFGPAGDEQHLYVTSRTGGVFQLTVQPDGTLASPLRLDVPAGPGQDPAHGLPQLIGLAFQPGSTPAHLALWVTTNDGAQVKERNPPDFSGALALLQGPANAFGRAKWTVRQMVSGLPRSVSDHETNSLAFSPSGDALYVTQAANTSAGAPDPAWGMRAEHLLNSALLRVDYASLEARPASALPVSVNTAWTEDPTVARVPGGNDYDPRPAAAPVRLYATGLRNAFDLVFHSNGALYLPTNGAGAGGNSPTSPAKAAACAFRPNGPYTGATGIAGHEGLPAQHDFLFRVDPDLPAGQAGPGDFRPGGYYGSPDPSRCEFILGAGNPSTLGASGAVTKGAVVKQYAAGTSWDQNYRGYVKQGDLSLHFSPDGAVEFRSTSAFGGKLAGALVIAEYAANRLLILKPESMNGATGLAGRELQKGGQAAFDTGVDDDPLTDLVNPLDVAEAPDGSGRLYVTELDAAHGQMDIKLLTPQSS